jgi:hypothetical protein
MVQMLHRSKCMLPILAIAIVLLSTMAFQMPPRLAHADQTATVFWEDFSNSGCPLDLHQQCVPRGWAYSGTAAHYGVEGNTEASIPPDWVRRGNPDAYLDVPFSESAYFQSGYFNLTGPAVLSLVEWGHHDTVSLSIGIFVRGRHETLPSAGALVILANLDPPKYQLSQPPQSREYTLGSQFVGQNISILLGCTGNSWGSSIGTFCDYDDILVQSQMPQPPPTVTTTANEVTFSGVSTAFSGWTNAETIANESPPSSTKVILIIAGLVLGALAVILMIRRGGKKPPSVNVR